MESPSIDAAALGERLRDTHRLSVELLGDLDDDQLLGPYARIVNPPLWEIGHVAWFCERWVLRHALGQPCALGEVDPIYDSIVIEHRDRWRARLPDRATTFRYLDGVHARIQDVLATLELDERLRYFCLLALFHEDMHNEAFAYTRQTWGYPATASLARGGPEPLPGDGGAGDLAVAGGRVTLGSARGGGFVFDNEKWAHEVDCPPFSIAREPVTEGEFAAFVQDGGYAARALWSDEGWAWRAEAEARSPLYWRRTDRGFERRRFGAWEPIEPRRPMLHVSFHEAQAFCRWAGRRLPTEVEWEQAALAGGCEGMFGNAWEWTDSTFLPFPGFSPDPYAEYSAPWFGSRKVLRGAAWVTAPRLHRPNFRNFYEPDRRDVWSGFRTCACES